MFSYTKYMYRPVVRHICLGRPTKGYSRRKVLITAETMEEIVRHSRKKLAGDTLDLSQVS